MLVLQRTVGQKIIIDLRHVGLGLLEICQVEIRDGGKSRLGITADKSIPVHRAEVYEAIEREKADGLWRVQYTTFNGMRCTQWYLLEAEARERAERLVMAGAVVEPIKYWPRHAIEAVKESGETT